MKEKNQSHWALAELAEQEAPAQSIHLWSKIKTSLTPTEDRRYPTTRRIGALALVLLAMCSLFLVPKVRAYAEDIFQRMGIAFVNTDLFGETDSVEAVPAIQPSEPIVSASLEDLRAQVSFPLLAPKQLPEGLDFVTREIWQLGKGAQVYVSYGRSANLDPEKGLLMLIATEGPISAPPLLAASKEEATTVNGQAGIYVHGGWQDNGQGDPNTQFGDLLWDDAIDSAYLTWEQGGVTYLLEAHQLGLELNDLLEIASSMSE